MDHVAILLRPYIKLILEGVKTVESRLTVTSRAPYRRIVPGERIYFKASSGPYMATAIAGKVEFHENLTPARVEALRRRHNAAVRGQREYWELKRNSRYATFIRLREVRATGDGPRIPPSRGPAWFTLEEPSSQPPPPEVFDIPLTRGAFTTRVLRVPPRIHRFAPSAYGGTTEAEKGSPVQLHMPDGRIIPSDVVKPDYKFRWRGWPAYLSAHGLKLGDLVRFERIGLLAYHVSFLRQPSGPHMTTLTHSRTKQGRPLGSGRRTNRAIPTPPVLNDFLTPGELGRLIRAARREDLGPNDDDITSRLLIPADRTTRAVLCSRATGRLSGAALLPAIARAYDRTIGVKVLLGDGAALAPGTIIAEIAGPLRSVLAMERVALNFIIHLSGIATLTADFVAAVAGTSAGIYDIRKTLPGLRALEKYAVACGGGHNHRMGLYDAVLVKDNHLAHLSLEELPTALKAAITRAKRESPAPRFIEIEVDTLEQLERVLPLGPDIVLLDNMTLEQTRQSVALRNQLAPGVKLEASGNVRIQAVREIAQTGVDRIAIGFLTHSAPALDIGLDIEA